MTEMNYSYQPGFMPGYYPQPMDQLAQLRQNQQPAQQGVIWVQGEEGAKGYLVAAGNSVILMDSEASTFYLKSTDQSGMPRPLRIFDYTERATTQNPAPAVKNTEYVTREEFEAVIAKLSDNKGVTENE